MSKLRALYKHFQQDSLFRNSIYLILATAVMSGFGFIFWIFGAKLFTTEQIGIASSLISVTGIISGLSLLGFNNSIIKYLPIAESPDKVFRNAVTLTSLASVSISIIALIILRFSDSALSFITHNFVYSILFVFFTSLTTLNFVIENTFIALRKSIRVFLKNTVFSIVKLVTPLFLINLAAFGLFTSIGVGLFAACIYSVYYLAKYNLHFRPSIDKAVVRTMMKFSLSNYFVSVFNGLPTLAMPLIITHSLGATASGYFYIDFLIITLLFVIPAAVSNSFFAEGAQKDAKLRPIIISVTKITYGLLIPAIILIILFGPFVLTILGKNYGTEGASLLRILALSGVFVGFNSLCGSFLNLQHKVKELVIVNIIGVILVVGSVYICIKFGLNGVGYGWLIGQGLLSLTYLLYVIKPLRSVLSKTATSEGLIAS